MLGFFEIQSIAREVAVSLLSKSSSALPRGDRSCEFVFPVHLLYLKMCAV